MIRDFAESDGCGAFPAASGQDKDRARILVVDDHRAGRKVLTDLLKDEHMVVQARGGAQGLDRVREDLPDLVLLDVLMPDVGGFEFLRLLKEDERTRDVPVVFVTAADDLESEEKGLKLGAMDYIVKPFNPSILRVRVRNLVTMVRQKKLLEKLALLDALTEIPNRRSFETALDREWQRGLRHGHPLSLAILDVDFLKEVNDRFGHPEGDRILKAVAAACQGPLRRPFDLAARFGGDEFAILLPETPGPEAVRICRSIMERVHAGVGIQGEAGLTVSLGGATAVPRAERASQSLVKEADRALYQAKQAGRNRLVWGEEVCGGGKND